MSNPLPALSLLETRVLGVLVEKQHTVPDSYPLTLNALVSGANQKTSRDPVIEATEAEVQATVDHLKSLSLVMESSGGRVMRYAHNAGKALGLPPQSVALIAVLFLRGPQTAGELRMNSERLHKFGDICRRGSCTSWPKNPTCGARRQPGARGAGPCFPAEPPAPAAAPAAAGMNRSGERARRSGQHDPAAEQERTSRQPWRGSGAVTPWIPPCPHGGHVAHIMRPIGSRARLLARA
jgi:hypothetical protein